MNKDYILKEDEILEIKSDRLFHDLWNEHEMDTIEWTVMQILNCSYEDIHGKVRVGNIRLTNLSKDDKQKYVDLVVYYKETITVIELNNNASTNYLRNVLYTLNTVNNSFIEGDGYTDKRVRGILVNLNWFKNDQYKDKIKSKEEIIYGYPINGEEDKDYLLKIININLDYFSKLLYNKTKESDILWKLFTINKKSDLEKIVSKEKMLSNYENKIKRLSQDKEYCKMVWDERIERNLRAQQEYFDGKQEGLKEGKEKGIIEGKKEGIIEGILKNKKDMVINLNNNGVSIDIISKSTGLSKEEIQKIIKSN